MSRSVSCVHSLVSYSVVFSGSVVPSMTVVMYLAMSINIAARSSPLGQHCWIGVMYFCMVMIAVGHLCACTGLAWGPHPAVFQPSKCQEELCIVRVCPAAKKQAFQFILFLSFTVTDIFQPVSIWGIKSSDESKSRARWSLETMIIPEQTPHLGPEIQVVQPSCKHAHRQMHPRSVFFVSKATWQAGHRGQKVLNVLRSQCPMSWMHNPHDSLILLCFPR